jgi:hypothetical protein
MITWPSVLLPSTPTPTVLSRAKAIRITCGLVLSVEPPPFDVVIDVDFQDYNLVAERPNLYMMWIHLVCIKGPIVELYLLIGTDMQVTLPHQGCTEDQT